MKLIAVPTTTNEANEIVVDNHFGHCAYYTVLTIENNNIVKTERLDSPQGCGCKSNIASTMQEMGISLMLAGNMGEGAFNKLSEHNIEVVRGCSGKVDDVVVNYLNGTLKDSKEACDHHDCTHHDNDFQHTQFTFAGNK